MREAVYVDSGAFIAFLVRSDQSHEEIVGLFSHRPPRWLTSTLVISESYSWFLHRLGEQAARSFRYLLEDLSGLEILDGDETHREAVWTKLDHYRGLKLSFVDASSLVWLSELRIRTVWSTDHHLGLEGARLRPVSGV